MVYEQQRWYDDVMVYEQQRWYEDVMVIMSSRGGMLMHLSASYNGCTTSFYLLMVDSVCH